MFDVWQNVLAELKKEVSEAKFVTYLEKTSLISTSDGNIEIGVPNTFMATNVKKFFDKQIRETLQNNNVSVKNIEYKVVDNKNVVKRAREVSISEVAEQNKPKYTKSSSSLNNSYSTGLSSQYRFDNFVVGSNNDVAVQVAKHVVDNPGTKFNPFFLYGGPGLGKTHLVQAIGNELLKRNPSLKILYIPINHFYTEFINALKNDSMEAFRKKFARLDVLIVDDFQFIVGKEKSQEEFFHLFNDMHQANRQVIITSDRLPSQIKTIDERLASRLTMAGPFDIQMPSFEDRCAILKSKSEFDGVEIEDEAIEYIAENVKNNIRDLEGLYTKLITLADLKEVSPLQLIHDGYAVSSSVGGHGSNVSPKKVVETVSKFYNMPAEEMCSKTRVSNVKNARQVAMYILSEDYQISTPKIASLVGVKDHTTVMHGIKKVKSDLKINFQLRDEINEIRGKLNA